MIVAIEGLEGTGKTSIAKMAAARLGGAYIKTPPEDLNQPRQYIASRGRLANFYFYLSGLYCVQASINEASSLGKIVLIDRYIHSTIAYCDDGLSFIPPQFDSDAILTPDLTIQFSAPTDLRVARINGRGFHIFDRREVDESAIEAYLSSVSDRIFANDGDNIEAAVDAFEELLVSYKQV